MNGVNEESVNSVMTSDANDGTGRPIRSPLLSGFR